MPSQFTLSMNDYDGDPSSMSVASVPLTAANLAAQTALWDALVTAIDAISVGQIIQETTSIISKTTSSKAKAASSAAKRGNKWLVSYTDVTADDGGDPPVENMGFGKLFQVEVPIATISLRDENSDIVYNANNGGIGANAALFEAFVTAFEDFVRSPYGGAVVVEEIRAVTINLS